jgi:hypothetical protein
MNFLKCYIFIFVFLFTITQVFAHSSYTGYTLKTRSTGCAGCHASLNSAVIVTLTGSDTIVAGTDASYSVKISGGGGTSVCVDIAVSGGTLKISDSNLKLSNGELITNGVKTYSNGSYTYNFIVTAPATPQAMTIYVTGMSTKAAFNFAPNKAVKIVTNQTDVESIRSSAAASFALMQNYPNPFNPTTEIKFSLSVPGRILLNMYDAKGHEIATLVDGYRNAGIYIQNWNASALPSGVYFCRLTRISNDGRRSALVMKLMLMK